MFGLGDFVRAYLTNGLLYLGPETIMPLASIIAAVIGFLLIAWRSIWKFVKKGFYFVIRKSPEMPAEEQISTLDGEDDTQEEIHSL